MMRSRGGVGEPRCASCGAVLTPEEAHYYECHCEGCERADMGREDAQEGRDTVSRHEYEAALARAEKAEGENAILWVNVNQALDGTLVALDREQAALARNRALEEGLRALLEAVSEDTGGSVVFAATERARALLAPAQEDAK